MCCTSTMHLFQHQTCSKAVKTGLKLRPDPECTVSLRLYTWTQSHKTCCYLLFLFYQKKGRSTAVTHAIVFWQITSMLLSGCTGNVLILWRVRAISEVLHFNSEGWKVLKLEDMCSQSALIKGFFSSHRGKNQKKQRAHCLPADLCAAAAAPECYKINGWK